MHFLLEIFFDESNQIILIFSTESCKVYLQRDNTTPFPCPVTNLRLRVTAGLTAKKLHQNITATLYWDLPKGNPRREGNFSRCVFYLIDLLKRFGMQLINLEDKLTG